MRARRTYVESVPEEEEPVAIMLHYVNGCFGVLLAVTLIMCAITVLIAAFR